MSDYPVESVVDELADLVGVKEKAPRRRLAALLKANEVQECVQETAQFLGLPVRISLSYVSKHFVPGNTNRFDSGQLVRTSTLRRGAESIAAQVTIPESLPMYGSSSLVGYPIPVRVSENCCECPETFIAMMAHELSHVLLRSLMHPKSSNELYTEIVPILLGFSRIIDAGRKVINRSWSGNTVTKRTTSYGYLEDWQFRAACDRVEHILTNHVKEKEVLLRHTRQAHARNTKGIRQLRRFQTYLQYVDQHPRTKLREEHGAKLVEYHSLDYTRQWQRTIDESRQPLDEAMEFASALAHYNTATLQCLQKHRREVSQILERLENLNLAIKEDLNILRRYVSFSFRIRSFLRRN